MHIDSNENEIESESESMSEHFGYYLPIHDDNLHNHTQSRSDIWTERLLV